MPNAQLNQSARPQTEKEKIDTRLKISQNRMFHLDQFVDES